jgi:hypothetical protein
LKWVIAFALIGFVSSSCYSQASFVRPVPPTWSSDPALFLEPNHFSVEKEMLDRSLWLQVGYGHPFLYLGKISIGLEALAWSRLLTLSQFRFPVQTVDYFFGAYAVLGNYNGSVNWRLRLGHISSHLVDGTDSITGGSSSKYSREFVELMREVPLLDGTGFSWTLGVRGYFHQVTRIEPYIAFPCCLRWRFAEFVHAQPLYGDIVTNSKYPMSLFISSGDGPVWPSIAAGFQSGRVEYDDQASIGLQLYYYYGASWAGTDAGAKVSQLKLQLDVRDF